MSLRPPSAAASTSRLAAVLRFAHTGTDGQGSSKDPLPEEKEDADDDVELMEADRLPEVPASRKGMTMAEIAELARQNKLRKDAEQKARREQREREADERDAKKAADAKAKADLKAASEKTKNDLKQAQELAKAAAAKVAEEMKQLKEQQAELKKAQQDEAAKNRAAAAEAARQKRCEDLLKSLNKALADLEAMAARADRLEKDISKNQCADDETAAAIAALRAAAALVAGAGEMAAAGEMAVTEVDE